MGGNCWSRPDMTDIRGNGFLFPFYQITFSRTVITLFHVTHSQDCPTETVDTFLESPSMYKSMQCWCASVVRTNAMIRRLILSCFIYDTTSIACYFIHKHGHILTRFNQDQGLHWFELKSINCHYSWYITQYTTFGKKNVQYPALSGNTRGGGLCGQYQCHSISVVQQAVTPVSTIIYVPARETVNL